MDKIVLHMNLTRKKSPGTYRMESSAPKVLSRYLRAPTGSCHDHCKFMITTQPIEPKTLNLFPKRVPKAPTDRSRVVDADHSLNRLKKAHSVVPIAPTRITNTKNNKFVKDEGLKRDGFKFSTKKDVSNEQKSRDLKPKSQVSRTSGRRHSDIFQPNEDMVIPLRVPRRRLSDVGSRSNSSTIKNESRKDSKLPSVMNNKSNSSLRTIVSSPKPGAKVLPPLRNYRSLPKLELKGSRKLKPTKTIGLEIVPEKTLHAIQRTKSQIPISSTTSSSSSCAQKVIRRNRLQKSCSSLMEDNSFARYGQYNDKIADSEDKTEKMVGKLVVETMESEIPISSTSSSILEEKVITTNALQELCSPSMEDNTPAATDDQYNVKIVDSEDKNAKEVGKLVVEETTESQVPISPDSSSSFKEKVITQKCPPSMEDDGQTDDTIEDSEDANRVGKLVVETTDDQYNKNIADSKDKNAKEVQKLVVETTESQIPISPAASSSSSSSSEEKVVTQESPPSMENDDQNDDTLEDSEDESTKDAKRFGKLVVETEDLSLEELRFRTGKVLSPQSENSSPRKVQFKQGKELEENETEKVENIKSLRRLSSDGVLVTSPEISNSINVNLKHQDVVEKKDSDSLNKIIEETASKLIQTRKSKVKALVGAFENITW